MNRRQLLSAGGAAMVGAAMGPGLFGQAVAAAGGPGIAWRRDERSRLFEQVSANGRPLLDPRDKVGVMDGFCSMIVNLRARQEVSVGSSAPEARCGPVQLTLAHALRRSGGSAEDLLEGTLTLRNTSDQPCEVACGFLTGVRPCPGPTDQRIDLPLTASALGDAPNDQRRRMKDCRQSVSPEGFLCHYLEVQASDWLRLATRAPLLAPVLDLSAEGGACHVALFAPATEPVYFEALQGTSAKAWRIGSRVRLAAGEVKVLKAWLLLHDGDAPRAWEVFRAVAHREEFPPIAWTHDVRVHYYDFLSGTTADGHRGGGYDLDLRHFAEFHVGMATQHGYYLSYGDFINPDRKQWRAMPSDLAGPVEMSIEKIRQRVQATRDAGVRPAIYMHFTILDEGSPLFEKMRDSIQLDAAGRPVPFGWEGPDVIKKTWKMSHASPQWRDHLVQQAHWIMELFKPDAIVLDETFSASGFDHHPQHGGALSAGGIELMRKLRAAVRSYGADKALFASDCSMGNFCLWGDGEAGDHCYPRLLGDELYRTMPIRYLAPLGKKAWLPCAWLCKSLWPAQVDLAKKVRAAVSVTDGWGDNLGLTRLPEDARREMLADIAALAKG